MSSVLELNKTLVFFPLMLFTKSMLSHVNVLISSSVVFAQAYGADTYGCGNYQEGCTTSTGTTTPPTTPNTGMLLTEPSFVVPGSLLLAVIIAVVTTTVAKLLRQRKANAK